MNQNLADITLVVDRSGSMGMCREEAEAGVNHFIEDQKTKEGDCRLTLVQFDTEYEFVHSGVDIREVPKFVLQPRGMTALLDAVGRAIHETGGRLRKMPEEDRPGLVVFVIVTDGQENSSHEFNKQQISDLLAGQQKDYSWQFTFLGANQDAFKEAAGMAIPKSAALNYNTKSSKPAFAAASANVGRMRGSVACGQSVDNFYTDEERSAATS